MKKTMIVFLLAAVLSLVSCKNGEKNFSASDGGQLDVNKYISSLSAEQTAELKEQTDLLLHPLKDAIERYGNDYELICEGSYAQVRFPKAKCDFEVYIGGAFEIYNDEMTPGSYDAMEHLAFARIERVIFREKGKSLTDGISIGMSAGEISEKLKVNGLNYRESNSMITTEYDENGEKVDVYYVSGQLSDIDYNVVFAGDVLARVELLRSTNYLTDEDANADHGKQMINEAVSFVSENGLAAFSVEDLSYKGKLYEPHYDSWFYSWQFTRGNYKDYKLCVEQNAPNRIYIAPPAMGIPLVFWCDGQYVDPILSFVGKWREHGTKEYIDIKSISKEGIVVFDMYVHKDLYTEDMVLLENLSVAINDIPKTLEDYLFCVDMYEPLTGDAQLFDGNVQSGYYTYAGDKMYLIDSLVLDFNGSVQYLPRGIGGRVGAGPLSCHIPDETADCTQPSTWGYMENFGRDDPNKENIVSRSKPAGESVINQYLNKIYETADIQYAKLEYRYLYDYVFPVNDVTYHVWESMMDEDPHYLYVDAQNALLIQECKQSSVSRHTKELIFKQDTVVSSRSYSQQKFISLDGNITADLINKRITKADAFVSSIDFPAMYFDTVGKHPRLMFFAEIGNRFMLNGYILFDVTTWGATLHITDSNIPDFDIGVYYLGSETFFLDPSIGVIGVPDNEEENQYIDDKMTESGKETKLVIRDFGGKIIGYIYVDENGKKTAKDFYGRILGYYYPDRDVTTDFYGRIIARGDAVSALLFTE